MSEATGTTRDAVVSYLKDRAAVDAAKLVGCAGMFRTYAEMAEAEGQVSLAKRYREAAHRCQEGAAWLNDERQAAGPQDIEATPPMTLERAVEVLNERRYRDLGDWGVYEISISGTERGLAVLSETSERVGPYSGFEAIAVANQLLRDIVAPSSKEVADA